MKIADEKIREIRERASILEVVSEYLSLKKSGANYQGCCPFHGEKTPSFNVNPARGIFHCFGCGVGGNAINFIMRIESMNFPQAAKHLAKRYGVDIPERQLSRAEKQKMDEKEELFRITEIACQFYRRMLLVHDSGEPGRVYLEQRGVNATIAETFKMGFAPAGWDNLLKHLQKEKVSLQQAEKLGLLRKKEGGGYYDTFRNRLLFTISDPQGRPIAFGGRVLDNSTPKYINSPESLIYHKSEVLFGLDIAKKGITESGTALVVEGYFDHLALYINGHTNVVATCGTALTPAHLKLMGRYAERAQMLYDGDDAGRKAVVRSMGLFLEEDFPAKVITLPQGDDPDTFLRREGAAGMKPLLQQALPIFEFFYKGLANELDVKTVEGKVAFTSEVTPLLAKIKNPVEKELYELELSRMLDIDPVLLKTPAPTSASSAKPAPVMPKKRAEDVVLMLMVKFPKVAAEVKTIGPKKMLRGMHLRVAHSILSQGAEVSASLLMEEASPEAEKWLSALLMEEVPLNESEALRAFSHCRQALLKTVIKADRKGLMLELTTVDRNSPRYKEIMVHLHSLRK